MTFIKSSIVFITLLLTSCTVRPIKDTSPKPCEDMLLSIPVCKECNGYFGLYSRDIYGTGDNSNRGDGGIYRVENNVLKDINGGSWFVNDLEFEKKVNGYGHSGFGGNKPNFDKFWGSTVNLTLNGNKVTGVDSISTKLYLPQKLNIEFKINEENVSNDNYYEPTKLKKGSSLTLTWKKDKSYKEKVLISVRFNKPLNYPLKNSNDFRDIDFGQNWTPQGTVKRIVRLACYEDNGFFLMNPTWFDDIAEEVVWIHISRRTSKKIKNKQYSYMVLSDYEVSKSFRIK